MEMDYISNYTFIFISLSELTFWKYQATQLTAKKNPNRIVSCDDTFLVSCAEWIVISNLNTQEATSFP